MKNLAKQTLYSFIPFHFKKPIPFSYVFHTEAIQYKKIYEQLIKYCIEFYSITGTKPICTVMPGNNARIEFQMKEEVVSQKVYAERILNLQSFAEIGYHGHFYKDGKSFDQLDYEIKKHNNTYPLKTLKKQFTEEVNWFKENNIPIEPIYSAGWWFMDNNVIELLKEHKFKLDFSFSKSPWFWNPYSTGLYEEHHILGGEPFMMQGITFMQNFVGCHTTTFPQDFIRNVNKILNDGYLLPIGSMHSHDYDLDYKNTIKCIRHLVEVEKCKFYSSQEMLSIIQETGYRTLV